MRFSRGKAPLRMTPMVSDEILTDLKKRILRMAEKLDEIATSPDSMQ